jgi:hypothetical protein
VPSSIDAQPPVSSLTIMDIIIVLLFEKTDNLNIDDDIVLLFIIDDIDDMCDD